MARIDAGINCQLAVTSTSMASTSFGLTLGYQSVHVTGVQPWDTITEMKIKCQGGAGYAEVNWMTVQNGPYEWAPFQDVSMQSTSTMIYPSTGMQTFVRTSEAYDGAHGILLAGSDVGGFAWADAHDPETDPTTWHMANGRTAEWVAPGDLQVSDAYASWRADTIANGVPDTSEYTVYALTAHGNSFATGALWSTDNLTAPNQSWQKVDPTLGAYKHRDDCPDNDAKEISSGNLIIDDPGWAGWLLVAGQLDSYRGVYFYEEGTTNAFTLYTDLPENGTGGYDAMPSALASNEVDTDAPVEHEDWILVGYRVLTAKAGPGNDYNALYACPAGFDPGSSPTPVCVPVVDPVDGDWIGDVRDIQADPTTYGRFFVADGGRRFDDGLGQCDGDADPTVWVVDMEVLGGSPVFDVWDTDTSVTTPTWNEDSGGTDHSDYHGINACYNAAGATYGDLVPPGPNPLTAGHELSSIAVDPGGDWLFAFFPLRDSTREYGCARVFRAPIGSLTSGSTVAWRPFQDYEYGNMAYDTSDHAAARRSKVDARGAFMEAEPLLEDWAPGAVNDAVFVLTDTGAPDLLAVGNFAWWSFRDDDGRGLDVGWNTPWAGQETDTTCSTTEDLDCADWALALGDPSSDSDGGSAFQDQSATSLAVCPACGIWGETPYDVLIGAGLGDYKMGRLYGGDPASRWAADRPCEFQMLLASGLDVEIWRDPENVVEPQAWMLMTPQGTIDDPGMIRGVFWSEQDSTAGIELGDDWCWDAAQFSSGMSGMASTNYLRDDIVHDWGLTCQDSDMASHQFFPCDVTAGGANGPFNVSEFGVGNPRDLVPVGDRAALLIAFAACSEADCTDTGGAGVDDDTRGVWLVEHTGSTGLEYTEVEYDQTDDCDEDELLRNNAGGNSRSRIFLAPDSDPAGELHFYVTSRSSDCGIYDVRYTPGFTPIWTKVPLTVSCDLDGTHLEGVTPTHDGAGLLAWGNAVAAGTGGGVCYIDLASGTNTNIIPSITLIGSVWRMVPHPHIADTYYLGLFSEMDGCTTCKPAGVYQVQRRYEAQTASYHWGSSRLSGDALEHRRILDLDWGPSVNAPAATWPARHLYITTSGGGFWDGEVEWP